MIKPLRSGAGEQKTLTSPLRMIKPLRSGAGEQKTLTSPLRMKTLTTRWRQAARAML
jgi:broad specificity polyphosphatase/5'/3'-nucleotidase SurE